MFTGSCSAFFLLAFLSAAVCYHDGRGGRQQDGLVVVDSAPEPWLGGALASICRHHIQARGEEICGRDGHTYPNLRYINCLNRNLPKSKRIYPASSGACSNDTDDNDAACDRNMLYQPICASDNLTYANPQALNCKNTIVPGYQATVVREGECKPLRCPCRTPDQAKVCASNGITYRSVGEVQCLRRYNPGLNILHSGGCTVREVRRAQGRRSACHMAHNRYEWNPVCALNNLTYANPYVYICHHPPNEGKCAARPGECGTLRQLACARTDLINQQRLEASSVVCGSNGVTYRSYEHLHCATIYDRYLEAVRTGRCTKADDPCQQTTKPLIGRGSPVCGSDNKSYTSINSLWCVKYLGKKDLKFKHDGPCI